RVNETATPPADDAAQQPRRMLGRPALGYPRWPWSPTSAWCRRNDRNGTLIRHAPLHLAAPILELPVAMVEPAFRAALVAAAGAAPLLESRCGTARNAAIALSTITVLTDPEPRGPPAATETPRTEISLAMNRQCPPMAGWTTGNGSWQVRTSFDA